MLYFLSEWLGGDDLVLDVPIEPAQAFRLKTDAVKAIRARARELRLQGYASVGDCLDVLHLFPPADDKRRVILMLSHGSPFEGAS